MAKNRIGEADHASPARGLMASLPFRTALQGLGTDVAVAVALVIYDATQSDQVDWRLLGASVLKTAVMTGASYVMKRKRPPVLS